MRTTALAAALGAAVVSLTACGKPLLYGEIEIADVKVTIPEQSFPATSNPDPVYLCPAEVVATLPAGMSCLERAVTYDLGKDFTDLTKDAVDYDLRLTDLAIVLSANPSIDDFRAVYQVRVGVEASGTLPAVDLASYQRSPADPTPTRIAVRAMSNVDLAPYVKQGQVAIFTRMIFDFDLPAFNADVTGDFYLRVLVDYGKKAGIY